MLDGSIKKTRIVCVPRALHTSSLRTYSTVKTAVKKISMPYQTSFSASGMSVPGGDERGCATMVKTDNMMKIPIISHKISAALELLGSSSNKCICARMPSFLLSASMMSLFCVVVSIVSPSPLDMGICPTDHGEVLRAVVCTTGSICVEPFLRPPTLILFVSCSTATSTSQNSRLWPLPLLRQSATQSISAMSSSESSGANFPTISDVSTVSSKQFGVSMSSLNA
mmetsp:Transcript_40411/g.79850  ORF Transcript_40411/g.79850 Transcript_40411/m.79850 type:complete len:225 (-) Transcript_40411:1290-1964(-)